MYSYDFGSLPIRDRVPVCPSPDLTPKDSESIRVNDPNLWFPEEVFQTLTKTATQDPSPVSLVPPKSLRSPLPPDLRENRRKGFNGHQEKLMTLSPPRRGGPGGEETFLYPCSRPQRATGVGCRTIPVESGSTPGSLPSSWPSSRSTSSVNISTPIVVYDEGQALKSCTQ